jgi:hypothetical protein
VLGDIAQWYSVLAHHELSPGLIPRTAKKKKKKRKDASKELNTFSIYHNNKLMIIGLSISYHYGY